MIVIDASVVITALLPEAESAIARSLIANEVCIAPDPIISECINALWKNVKLNRILVAEAEIALETLPNLGISLMAGRELAGRAFDLAVALDHPAYDCFYLALAEHQKAPLFTQDGRFLRKIQGSGVSKADVRLLASVNQ